MNYKNLRFKWGNGKFVESAKQPSEGFQKIEYTDPDSKTDKVTYHKFHDEVSGIISSVGMNETHFGTFLRVNVKTGTDEITSIQVPYENQYGFSRETKALISSLRDYKLGEDVTIKPVVKTFTRRNGNEGKDVNFYINYKNIMNDEGKPATTGYIKFDELPELEKEEKRGKTTYNSDKQMDFYYEVLQKVVADFEKYWEDKKANSASNTEGDASASAPEEEKAGALEPNAEFNEDDLPF